MLKKTIGCTGKKIRRILDETGIFIDVRAIADRFMRERGGEGIILSIFVCFISVCLFFSW